jgi:hypothetical protein
LVPNGVDVEREFPKSATYLGHVHINETYWYSNFLIAKESTLYWRSIGSKAGSKGYQQHWRGYKLHIDVAGGGIPITALLTSASLHDSQAAIPLATITAQRVTSLYDLMDAAYDAQAIAGHSRWLGHVPVIAPKGAPVPVPKRVQDSKRGYGQRRNPVTQSNRKRPPLPPAEQQRYPTKNSSR